MKKGISYKTILSVPRNFLNHLGTYISTGGGKSGSQAWKKITKKIEKKESKHYLLHCAVKIQA